jgi:flagellin-like protein
VGERRRRGVLRRGLSPLIATVVLISATIVGGVLIYNYFQESVAQLRQLGENVVVSVNSVFLNETSRMVYIKVTNAFAQPVTITGVKAFKGDGSTSLVGLQAPQRIEPGGVASLTIVLDETAARTVAVSVVYQVDGETLESEPVKLS